MPIVAVDEETADADNPYLALRAAKIARNEARLRELGLLPPLATMGRNSTSRAPSTATRTRLRAPLTRPSPSSEGIAEPTRRRSTRIRENIQRPGATPPIYHEPTVNDNASSRPWRAKSSSSSAPTNHETSDDRTLSSWGRSRTLARSVPVTSMPFESSSSSPLFSAIAAREISIDVDLLLFGRTPPPSRAMASHDTDHAAISLRFHQDNTTNTTTTNNNNNNNTHDEKAATNHAGVLGYEMTTSGKAWVMAESVCRAGIPALLHAGNASPPSWMSVSFNKYSGVQEWSSTADVPVMYLWVNLGVPNADVTNEFLNHGRQITWFGGSRMHEQTPVIQRLLQLGQQQQQLQQQPSHGSGETTSATPHPALPSTRRGGIILWVRQHLHAGTFTPYVCFGRLQYVSHEPHSQPLSFVWELADYDRLLHHRDVNVQRHFRELVSHYHCTEHSSIE